jgi:threonine synthase
MGDLIIPGWADEARVFATIGRVFREKGELIDPHTAVGVAVAEDAVEDSGPPVIIASTASPFKFAGDVLFAATGERWADEFLAIEKLSQVAGIPAHRAVRGLAKRPVRHTAVLDITQIREAVDKLVDGLDGSGR